MNTTRHYFTVFVYFRILWAVASISKKSLHLNGTLQKLLPLSHQKSALGSVNQTKKLIILLCRFRSGSTFLGEIFNQNPDVLYDFESLHPSPLKKLDIPLDEYATARDAKMKYLQYILQNCSVNFNAFGRVLNRFYLCGRNEKENLDLFGKPYCNESELRENVERIRYIRRAHCKKRDAVVIKVIRMDRLRDIDRIPDIRHANLKIVHLIRDPRAMFNSRFAYFKSFYTDLYPLHGDSDQKRALSEYIECNGVREDVDFVAKRAWLLNKYMIVNYNDLILYPQIWAEKIYDFVNLKFPKRVADWIEGKIVDDNYYQQVEKTMKTQKNSSQIYQKWMKIKWYKVDKIKSTETQCSNVLRKFNRAFALDPEDVIRSYDVYKYSHSLHPRVNVTFL